VFESLLGKGQLPDLLRCLREGRDCIVEEATYCYAPARGEIIRVLAVIPNVQDRWVCFENNLESANWNVERRTNKRDVAGHLAINAKLRRDYTIPAGAEIRPIHRIGS
jgi:hypothetical protein